MKNIIYTIIVTFLFTACGNETTTSSETKTELINTTIVLNETQAKNIDLKTGKLEQKSISSLLKVNGKIDVPPQNMVSISVPLGGYLKSTKLLPGMKISKGEVIAIMEDELFVDLQKEYLTTLAQYNFTEKEYNRQKELNQSKAVSDKVFQQIETDFKMQKIALKSLSEKLKLISIDPEKLNENTISRSVNVYSPINGYVSKVNANIGKHVSASDELFELVNPEDIHLALTVFEKDVDKLFIGQKLIAYNNNSDKKHNCEILLISHDLASDRSVQVHCHFENYDKSLIPGMFMNAEVSVKSKDAFVIADEAIVNFEGKSYIFIEKTKNTFEMTEVETGIRENGLTELLSAEKFATKNIATKGAYSLLMAIKNKSEE